ncbi:MAG: hypothetical protein IPF92_04340 [Myxococcales bacterium]|jgi:hypothetical protein|nr:hypothetical protein [Myxococcales bacterium]HQY60328.1 hypothetical protein [Polyangiaceae bacterium]
MKANEVWAMSADERLACLRGGAAVAPERLAGADYRGVSLGLPRLVERLTWKTFRKSFRRDAAGTVSGLNVRLEQTGLDGAPVPRRDARGEVVSFGPFAVVPLPAGGTPFGCESGVVFDYGATHPAWNPIALTRDVVVALDPEHTLLFGALYVELGGLRLRTPSFFTLERER